MNGVQKLSWIKHYWSWKYEEPALFKKSFFKYKFFLIFKKLNYIVQFLAFIIIQTFTLFLLMTLFTFLWTPISLFWKLIGKDPLKKKFSPELNTYYESAVEHKNDFSKIY